MMNPTNQKQNQNQANPAAPAKTAPIAKAAETLPPTEAVQSLRALKPDEVPEVGNVPRTEYQILKQRFLNADPNNNRFIMIMPCAGNKGWCEVPDRSAILYRNVVCPIVNATANMTDDYGDYTLQYRIGKVLTQGYGTVLKRIQGARLYRSHGMLGKCMVIELNRSWSEEEMNRMIEEEKTRQSRMNEIVEVKTIDPAIYQKMMEVGLRLRQLCSDSMKKIDRDTFGREIVNQIEGMEREYLMFATELDPDDGAVSMHWRSLQRIAARLRIELQIAASTQIWSKSQCASVGNEVVELAKLVDSRYAKHEREVKKKVEKKSGEETVKTGEPAGTH